jgi:hypothetical protein
MKRAWFAIAVAGFALACGDDGPASLAIAVDKLPELTNAKSLNVTGSLTRVPAKKTTYVVSIIGGNAAIADTVDSAGHFSIPVPLKADGVNTFTVSATDAQGSASPSVAVSITQDNQPPGISSVTPAFAADLVSLTPTITLTLSEHIVAPGLILGVRQQGVVLPGTTSVSSDSLTYTYTLAAPLAPNAIYEIDGSIVKDAAGNSSTAYRSCFVTNTTGTTLATFNDGLNDVAQTTQPAPVAGLLPADLVVLRLGRASDMLSVVLKYSNARSFAGNADNAAVEIYFDVDQTPAGTLPIRDIGSDYAILAEPLAPVNGLGGVVKWNDAVGNGIILGTFTPDFCGPFESFAVPFSALANDDGNMDFLMGAIAQDATNPNALYIDFLPETSHLTLSLLAGAPTFPGATAAVQAQGPTVSLAPYATRMRALLARRARNP